MLDMLLGKVHIKSRVFLPVPDSWFKFSNFKAILIETTFSSNFIFNNP